MMRNALIKAAIVMRIAFTISFLSLEGIPPVPSSILMPDLKTILLIFIICDNAVMPPAKNTINTKIQIINSVLIYYLNKLRLIQVSFYIKYRSFFPYPPEDCVKKLQLT